MLFRSRRVFDAARDRIVDLYAPNNTHLSTMGYLLLGEQAVKALGIVEPPERYAGQGTSLR